MHIKRSYLLIALASIVIGREEADERQRDDNVTWENLR